MILVVRVTPNQVTAMVAVVIAVTADLVTAKAPLAAPPLTSASDGTCAAAVLLLDSATNAPSVAPVNVIVPVEGLPPVRLDLDDKPFRATKFSDVSTRDSYGCEVAGICHQGPQRRSWRRSGMTRRATSRSRRS